MTRIIALIPARAGSKGVPQKNFQRVWGGKRLWEVQALAARGVVDEIYLSTDAGEELTSDAPPWVHIITRGQLESDDKASTATVVRHAATTLGIRDHDAILMLAPTFSRRRRSDVIACVEMYRAIGQSLIGFTKASEHPYLSYSIQSGRMHPLANPNVDEYFRRQDYPAAYRLTTFVCLVRGADLGSINAQCIAVEPGHSSLPVYCDPEKLHDVDTVEDLEEARAWLEEAGLP